MAPHLSDSASLAPSSVLVGPGLAAESRKHSMYSALKFDWVAEGVDQH
jgi:hypothetical protein